MQKSIDIKETPIQGLYVLERNIFSDNRGYFYKIFSQAELIDIGIQKQFTQINFSHSYTKGTTRGFHFQFPPFAENKIVTCLQGKVFDVAVDLRKNSKTFLKWFSIELSGSNNKSLYIPRGFGHGFQVLEDQSSLLYLHTEEYSKEYEGGISIKDPALNMIWPLVPENLSERDSSFIYINSNFEGIILNEM